MKKLILIWYTLLCTHLFAGASVYPVNELGKHTIKLIENKGQWESAVLFRAHIPGGTLFITENSLVYSMIDEHALHDAMHHGTTHTVKGHNFRVLFKHSQKPFIRRYDPSSEFYNFFLGNQPSKWANNCKAYGRIVLEELYPGIDMELIALDERLKINFIVERFADPGQIRLAYEGMQSLAIHDGAIEISTTVSALKESAPVSYQPELNNAVVATRYELKGNEVRFVCDTFNRLFDLIIDPEVIFGTFSGSIADNFGFTATYDTQGNGYAGGTVYNVNFPTTMGAFQLTFGGGDDGDNLARDCGILKFSANGSNLLYCTYLGGSGNEQPHSMICSSNGDLIIFGSTSSDNFPVSLNAYDRTSNGGYDAFVTRLNSTGTALVGSTYFGGNAFDAINGNTNYVYDPSSAPLKYNFADQFRGEVILDNFGNIVVVSATRSTIPIVNGFQTTLGGLQDGMIFRMNSSLTTLQFSSYLGGNGHDAIYGVDVDVFNNLFITGGTTSTNLTATSPFYPRQGGVDAFVAKISGNSLQRLLFLGTAAYDQAYLIQLDKNDDPYICGQTESGNFPVLGNTYRIAGGKHFISKFNNNLDQLLLSTTFGKGGNKPTLSPSAFMIDICGRIYFSGWGGATNQNSHDGVGFTTDLPVTFDAFQSTTDGSDFYLTVFTPELKSLAYATFIGDPLSEDHVDGGTSRFDPEGIVYQSVCAGCGGFSGFPTTPNAWSTTNKGRRTFDPSFGGCNNALLKMSLNVSLFPPEMKDTFISLQAGDSLSFITSIIDRDNDSIFTSWSGTFTQAQPNAPTITLQRFANINGLSAGSSRLSLRWRSDCSNIGDTFLLRVFTFDNGCPVSRSDTAWIRIAIVSPEPAPTPFPECLTYIDDSIAFIQWRALQSASVQSIRLHRSVNGAPPSIFKEFSQKTRTQFTDSTAFNHQQVNYCYFLTTLNRCNEESAPSRTICSMYKEDTASTKAFAGANDTVVFVTATDTLVFSSDIVDSDISDSVFAELSGTIFLTGRVLSSDVKPAKSKAGISFVFKSLCSDIGISDTLVMTVFVIDNQCPTPRSATFHIKVVVVPPPAGTGPAFNCIKKISDSEVEVGFSNYNPNRYYSHAVVIRKNPDGTFTTIQDPVNGNTFSIRDMAPDHSNSDYCYAAYPVTICGNRGDTSPFICSVTKPEDFPDPIRILTVTVEDNKHIAVVWNTSTDSTYASYRIYKREFDKPNFNRISEISSVSTNQYTDEAVEVSKKPYCYEVRQVNACGLESLNSKEACSIHLQGTSVPFEHMMEWNPYTYWIDGVAYYDIRKEEPMLSPLIVANIAPASTRFTDNRLNPDNGLYYYTVTAHENLKGLLQTSTSNTIELIQSPLLYVPNAFTPNTDGTNDEWKPRPVFVKDFDLKLYNRWGQLVFSTTDKKEYFSGVFQSQATSDDVYVYVITYTGWDNTTQTTTGNVTLIR